MGTKFLEKLKSNIVQISEAIVINRDGQYFFEVFEDKNEISLVYDTNSSTLKVFRFLKDESIIVDEENGSTSILVPTIERDENAAKLFVSPNEYRMLTQCFNNLIKCFVSQYVAGMISEEISGVILTENIAERIGKFTYGTRSLAGMGYRLSIHISVKTEESFAVISLWNEYKMLFRLV